MNKVDNSEESSTITTMKEKTQTTKIWKRTLQKLRFIKAYTGESFVKIIDRLVEEELSKYQNNKPL